MRVRSEATLPRPRSGGIEKTSKAVHRPVPGGFSDTTHPEYSKALRDLRRQLGLDEGKQAREIADQAVQAAPHPVPLKWQAERTDGWQDEDGILWQDLEPLDRHRLNGRQYAASECALRIERQKAPRDEKAFKAIIKRKYGNTTRAWRVAVSGLSGSSSMTKGHFGRFCREEGYKGDSRSLFEALKRDREQGTLYLADFDPEAARLLEKFRWHMMQRFRTSQGCWKRLSPRGSANLRLSAFCDGCRNIEFDLENESIYAKLHDLLDSNESKHINIDDITWLGCFETGADLDGDTTMEGLKQREKKEPIPKQKMATMKKEETLVEGSPHQDTLKGDTLGLGALGGFADDDFLQDLGGVLSFKP